MKKLFKDDRLRTIIGLGLLYACSPNFKSIIKKVQRMAKTKKEPFIEVHYLFEE